MISRKQLDCDYLRWFDKSQKLGAAQPTRIERLARSVANDKIERILLTSPIRRDCSTAKVWVGCMVESEGVAFHDGAQFVWRALRGKWCQRTNRCGLDAMRSRRGNENWTTPRIGIGKNSNIHDCYIIEWPTQIFAILKNFFIHMILTFCWRIHAARHTVYVRVYRCVCARVCPPWRACVCAHLHMTLRMSVSDCFAMHDNNNNNSSTISVGWIARVLGQANRWSRRNPSRF